MLCVEGGAVQRPVTLAPHERWHGTQTLVARERVAGMVDGAIDVSSPEESR